MGKFFVSRPIFAISIAIVIVMLGLISLTQLSIEQYPDITPPVVEVSATYEGADAQAVNDAVATPVAQSVMGVDDMLYMKSTSANDGSMSLQVTFEVGSSPDMDAIFTQNNVATATPQLPSSVQQQGVETRKVNTGFLMVYALSSDGRYDDEFLSNYAYINLRNELLKIDGVGKVQIMGAGEYAMRIWIRPDVLHYYGISLDEVIDAIDVQGGLYPAGKLGAEPAPDGTVYTYTVTMPAQLSTAEEFSEIIVATTDTGAQVRLADVADVVLGSQSYGMQSRLGQMPSTLIAIYQQPGSNAVEVGKNVRAQVARLESRLLDGLSITSIVDSTTSIKAGIHDIFVTLLIALALVILIIFIFLQDWRATVIPLVAIPVSLIGAFIMFPLLGFSLNIISLLGLVLAIGLVVDDAIVVVEAVQVNISQGMSSRKATIEAMAKVSSPIVATTLVLLAVFIPISFTGGISALIFRQFSITIAVAVVFSAINALTLSPSLCAMLLKARQQPQKGVFARFNGWFGRRMEHYNSTVSTMVKHTFRTGIFVAVLLGVIVICWKRLPSGFLPVEDQGYLMVFVTTPEASSLEVTLAEMERVDDIIRTLPEVDATALSAGFNMLAGISSTNCGIIFTLLKPYGERKASASEIADRLSSMLYLGVPGAESYAMVPPSIPGLGVASGVTFEVQDLEGRGWGYLEEQTEKLMDTIRGLSSVSSVTTQFNSGVPQRHLLIDNRKAMLQGVDMSRLYGELTTYLGGTYVNNFNRFGRVYQTYVQAAPDYRQDERALENYYITTSSGESVPLTSFVELRDTVGVEFLSQYNLYNAIEVTVTSKAKASSGEVMKQIASVADATLPDDIDIAWSGMSYQESVASKNGATVYLLALIFVFLALSALYNSWALPIAIMMSVPLAVAGALIAILVSHWVDTLYVNNIYMQISLVMLIGLAAKNAILVVEYADKLFTEQHKSLWESAVGAARMRVRPIIMTAFAFILGVMPLIFASGVYATARHIMGVALVGGMLLATLMGIFLYPASYYFVGRIARFERRRAKRIDNED
ncbi:MAG: efflux RND transporter permease subunit [Alistipes sp.]|nr:efflux RND transporter permease subunit [Alistipes sp.]